MLLLYFDELAQYAAEQPQARGLSPVLPPAVTIRAGVLKVPAILFVNERLLLLRPPLPALVAPELRARGRLFPCAIEGPRGG